jgi:hypothetical protein
MTKVGVQMTNLGVVQSSRTKVTCLQEMSYGRHPFSIVSSFDSVTQTKSVSCSD